MADKRITDLTQGRVILVDDVMEKDGPTGGSLKISPLDLMGQFGNAKAPAGALSFDGSGGFVYSTLTNQAIGTDDFTLTGFVDVPASNTGQNLGIISLTSSIATAAQANGVETYISSVNVLRCRCYGATTSAYREFYLDLAPWAGKQVFVVMKRVGAVFTLKINGGPAQTMTEVDSLPYTGTKYLALQSTNNNYLTTPDSANVSVTADITIDFYLKNAPLTANWCACRKGAGGGNRSFRVILYGTGYLEFAFSADGTNFTYIGSRSAPSGVPISDVEYRATWRQSDGLLRFSWRAGGTGSWAQLGADQNIGAGQTIFDSSGATGDLVSGVNENNFFGRADVQRLRLYNGFEGAGTLKAEFNAADATTATAAVTSGATGEVWSLVTSGGGTTPSQFVVESTTWARSITNTYLTVGLVSSGFSFIGRISRVGFANFGLSDAESIKLMEDGGVPQFKHRWGSQVNAILNLSRNSNFSALATDWSPTGAATVNAATGALVCTTGGHADRVQLTQTYAPLPIPIGAPFTITVSVSGYSVAGGTPQVVITREGDSGQTVITGNGTFSFSGVAANGPSYGAKIIISQNGAGSTAFTLDDIVILPRGFVVFLLLDDGIGFQAHDASTNKLDGIISTTGVTHSIERRRGYVRGTLTWAGTHEGKSLIGQKCFPTNAVLDFITRKPTASSSGSGCTIGTTGLANRWQTLAALAANTKAVATLALRIPAGTGSTENDIVVDPDTSNYTGSIEVECHYAASEGLST